MASTYDVIQKIERSSAGPISFTSIPETYTDLVIISSLNASAYQDLRMRINGDNTSSNYGYRGHSGYVNAGTSTGLVFKGNTYDGMLADYEALPDSTQGGHVSIFHLMSYRAPEYKISIAQAANLNNIYKGVDFVTSIWRSTSVVNSITLLLGSQDIGTGSFAVLYGIKSA
jgi:hypothetical protein